MFWLAAVSLFCLCSSCVGVVFECVCGFGWCLDFVFISGFGVTLRLPFGAVVVACLCCAVLF